MSDIHRQPLQDLRWEPAVAAGDLPPRSDHCTFNGFSGRPVVQAESYVRTIVRAGEGSPTEATEMRNLDIQRLTQNH